MIKRLYYSASHWRLGDVMMDNITLLSFLLFSMCQKCHSMHVAVNTWLNCSFITLMSFLWESMWLSCLFPQPTWRSHPSTDFDAKWPKRRGFTQGCAFWGKNRNFLKPLTPRSPNRQNFPNFGRDLENFRSISRLTLGSHEWTPHIFHRSPVKVSQWIGNVVVGNSNMYPHFV